MNRPVDFRCFAATLFEVAFVLPALLLIEGMRYALDAVRYEIDWRGQ